MVLNYLAVPLEYVFPQLHQDLPARRLVTVDIGHQPHLHHGAGHDIIII